MGDNSSFRTYPSRDLPSHICPVTPWTRTASTVCTLRFEGDTPFKRLGGLSVLMCLLASSIFARLMISRHLFVLSSFSPFMVCSSWFFCTSSASLRATSPRSIFNLCLSVSTSSTSSTSKSSVNTDVWVKRFCRFSAALVPSSCSSFPCVHALDACEELKGCRERW